MMKKFIKAALVGMMFLCCLACANRVSARDKDGDIVVIIDPGHGGRDGGAVQNGLTEKELNWNIAISLKAELETYEGVKVYLTKGYGEWNSNTGRGRYGVGLGGDIFISCHNNSGSSTARGSIVYTTVNSKYHDEMGRLANLILDNLSEAGFVRNGIQSRPSSSDPSADYYTALDEAAKAGMPSMIIEHCYISNAEDAEFISSLENQYKAGAADATGIAQYYGLKKRTVSAGSSVNLIRTYSAAFTGVQGKFSSSDENVAYVSDKGLITAMSQGSAVITCTADDGSKKTVNVTVPAVTQVAVTAGINPTFYESVSQAKNIDKSLVMMKAVYNDGSSVQVEGTIGSAGDPVSGTTNVFDIPISYGGYSNTLRVYGYSAVGTAYSSNHIPSGTNKDILLVPGNYSVKTNGNVTPETPTTPVPENPDRTEPETTTPAFVEPETTESISQEEITSKDTITDKTTEDKTSSIKEDSSSATKKDNVSDNSKDTSGTSVLKIIKIVVIVLLVLCAGAAVVFFVFYLKNKNK